MFLRCPGTIWRLNLKEYFLMNLSGQARCVYLMIWVLQQCFRSWDSSFEITTKIEYVCLNQNLDTQVCELRQVLQSLQRTKGESAKD